MKTATEQTYRIRVGDAYRTYTMRQITRLLCEVANMGYACASDEARAVADWSDSH